MATVLVVDDDAGMRSIVERILLRDGHTVSIAVDGVQALRLLESTEFDLLITDLVMPDIEGMQILRVLRKKAVRPRIIAMSGGGRGSAAEYLTVAASLGADATLAKPFTPEALIQVVHKVLD
jgi:DNA-binding response OmpR family regulator